MFKYFHFAIFLAFLLFAISANGAPVAYSVNADSGTTNEDSLYQIDLGTGAEVHKGKLIDPTTKARIDTEGLAITSDGTLWGVDDASGTLFPINAAGMVDLSREVQLANFPPPAQGLGGHDFGLTSSCGDILYIVSVQTRTLHKLKTDGTSEIIGASGALGANISAISAYGNPTQLYGLGNGTLEDGSIDSPKLFKIDLESGVAVGIGSLGDAVSDYDQAGLAFDEKGILWAITDRRIINKDKAANLESEILQIDIVTGEATVMWTTKEIGFESLAIASPNICDVTVGDGDGAGAGDGDEDETTNQLPTIPTLGPKGRLAAILILMFAGMTILRQRTS